MKRPSFKSKPKKRRGLVKRTIRKAKPKKTNASKSKAMRHRKRMAALKEPRPKLRPFQREGVDWIKENNFRGLLADSQGTGKTVQALMAIGENARYVCPVLVICPSSVAWNWEKEAFRWLRHKLRCHVVEGMDDKFPEQLPHVTVVSWDLLTHRIDDIIRHKWRFVVADEIHYAKNPEAKRTQAIHRVLQAAECEKILIMSGTPLVNTEEEFQAVKDIAGGDPPILRRTLEDVAPEIPHKTRMYIPVTLPDEIQAEYNQAAEEFGEWLDEYLTKVLGDPNAVMERTESTMKAENLIKVGYLRRILARGKVPAACAFTHKMVKKQNESLVVFGEHQDILDAYTEGLRKLKIPLVRIDGATNRLSRQRAIDAFQSGQIKVFLGSRAAFEGITLTRARHLMFLERFFTPAAEEQAEDRIRRIGQTRETFIWYLTAEGTIDERIEEIVDRKRRIIRRVVGQPNIDTEQLDTVVDGWRRLKPLNGLTKPLKVEPTITIPVPPTPHPKVLRGVIFNGEHWSIPMVQRILRRRGHKIRNVEMKGHYVFVITHEPEHFDKKTIKTIDVGFEFKIVAGKPASTSKRVMNYRR